MPDLAILEDEATNGHYDIDSLMVQAEYNTKDGDTLAAVERFKGYSK